jgi:hypothetical protein
MTFDESNGSQVEQIDANVVGKEDLPREAIKQMATGDVRPIKDQATEEDSQAVAAPISTDVLDVDVQHTPARQKQGGSTAPPTSAAV